MFGAALLSLISGAAQYAAGSDLVGTRSVPLGTPEAAVNRAAKADRAATVAPVPQTRTIALRLDGLSDTSVLVRIPLVREARSSAPPVAKSGIRKLTLACEPVVSVLTEIARQLQPGRCVT